ncbi:MAG: hypothetical protein ACHQ51_10820 [Elusimicrobiota bacterium]
MDVILPSSRAVPPSRPPKRGEIVVVALLLAVFIGLEYWKFPSIPRSFQRISGVFSLLGWLAEVFGPPVLAGVAIVGCWVGKIPSGLSLLGNAFLALISGGLAGVLGSGPVEYRDEDTVSFYFAVALYFALACGLVFLFSALVWTK